ncbi:MAG: AEC family transporter [Gammaproteobacteria bacterium]|nr:AEC family transporter [Gammaproteobacteria bacterium]
MLQQLAGILLPVFTLVGVGYGWRRLAIPFDREFVTRVIMNIAGPCLIVDSLSSLSLPLDLFMTMVAASIAMFAVTIAAAFVLLKALKLSIRSYLPALGIGNTGNLGLPLSLFAFGDEGLALAVAVYVMNSVGQFTLTPMLQSGSPALKTLATTPVVYGALIGAVLLGADAALPEWLATTVGLLGDLMIPLMLLALGNTLGGLHARRMPLAVGLGTIRLALGFGVALGVAEIFGLDGAARSVLVLQGAMPAAVFNYLFAARYGRDPEDIAGIVLASTVIAALIMPFLVSYLLWLAG